MESRLKTRILVLIDYFEPAFHAAGPIRSVRNLANALQADCDFFVLTRNHDRNDKSQLKEVRVGEWQERDQIAVRYFAPGRPTARELCRIVREVDPSLVYLNSAFSPRFSVLPLVLTKMRLFGERRILLAPRGEFYPGALRIKRWKKKPFISFARRVGLYDEVFWHASSSEEGDQIVRTFPESKSRLGRVFVAPDLAGQLPITKHWTPRPANAPLRVLFLSRISKKKNLDGAVRALRFVTAPVRFRIVGPVEDQVYMKQVRRLIQTLPTHITCDIVGAVTPEEVGNEMANADLFFLPSHGENYGHVFVEAAQAGTPLLISDQTPWTGLADGRVLRVRAVDDEAGMARDIEQIAQLGAKELQEYRRRAEAFAREVIWSTDVVKANREMLLQLTH